MVGSLCLGHGEGWDKHFVDEVYDPVVCAHVRPQHLSLIDRDACSQYGGDGVCGDNDVLVKEPASCFRRQSGRMNDIFALFVCYTVNGAL